MRLFIALDVPVEVHRWVANQQELLKRVFAKTRLRWAPTEQWHVTLRFLGELPEHSTGAILAAMKRTAQPFNPFELTFGKPGTFSGPRMGVLWLGVDAGLEPLKTLVAKLNQNLEAEDFPAEKRPFQGHLTMARSREKIPSSTLRNLQFPIPCPSAEVRSMHLYESKLTAGGAHYTRLHTVFFRT